MEIKVSEEKIEFEKELNSLDKFVIDFNIGLLKEFNRKLKIEALFDKYIQ